MKHYNDVVNVANALYAEVVKAVGEYAETRVEEVAKLVSGDLDIMSGLEKVSEFINVLHTTIRSRSADGETLPDFHCGVKTYDDGDVLNTIILRVRGKKGTGNTGVLEVKIKISETLIMDISNVITQKVFELYYFRCAEENVEELNEAVKRIIVDEEIDLPYSVGFVVGADSTDTSIISSISDTSIIFNLSVASALSIGTLELFSGGSDPDGYDELLRTNYIRNFRDGLEAAEIPLQLLCSKTTLLKDLVGINGDFSKIRHRQRVKNYLRDTYRRSAKYLGKSVGDVGYFLDKVTIKGEERKIFSLVERAEDGGLKVVLSPFDVETLLLEDVNVISLIEKEVESISKQKKDEKSPKEDTKSTK